MALRPCPACARPVRLADAACPFCATSVDTPEGMGTGTRARLAGGAIVLALTAACTSMQPQPVYGAPAGPLPSPSASPVPSTSPTPPPAQPLYGAPMPPSAGPNQ